MLLNILMLQVREQLEHSSTVPKIKKPLKLFLVVGSLQSLFIAVMALLGIALF